MHGTLSFYESLRRARDSLCVEKAAHAVTRAKLQHCEAELAKLQGSGGSVRTVAADTQGSPHEPCHWNIHKSTVAGDDSGAECGVPYHVPPQVGADGPGPSTQGTHSVAAEPEYGHCADLVKQTSPVIGDGSGAEFKVGDDNEPEPVRKEAAADAVRT